MKKSYLIFLALFAFNRSNAQQSAQYTQYMFNNIYVNPAYAGYRGNLTVNSSLRTQWVEVKGAPVSMSIAADGSGNDGKVGYAFQLASDKLGAQSTISAYGSYAYRLQFGNDLNSTLAFGVGLGVVQNGLNAGLLQSLEPDDPMIPANSEYSLLPDARAGIFYANEFFYAGFSADNLIAQYAFNDRNYNSFFPSPKIHLYLHGGAIFPINDVVKLKPSFLFKDDRRSLTSLDLNTFFFIDNDLQLGAGYRTSINIFDRESQRGLAKGNSMIAMIEFPVLYNFRIGYSVEMGINGFEGANSQTHEFSLTYRFKKKNEKRALSPRYF